MFIFYWLEDKFNNMFGVGDFSLRHRYNIKDTALISYAFVIYFIISITFLLHKYLVYLLY